MKPLGICTAITIKLEYGLLENSIYSYEILTKLSCKIMYFLAKFWQNLCWKIISADVLCVFFLLESPLSASCQIKLTYFWSVLISWKIRMYSIYVLPCKIWGVLIEKLCQKNISSWIFICVLFTSKSPGKFARVLEIP